MVTPAISTLCMALYNLLSSGHWRSSMDISILTISSGSAFLTVILSCQFMKIIQSHSCIREYSHFPDRISTVPVCLSSASIIELDQKNVILAKNDGCACSNSTKSYNLSELIRSAWNFSRFSTPGLLFISTTDHRIKVHDTGMGGVFSVPWSPIPQWVIHILGTRLNALSTAHVSVGFGSVGSHQSTVASVVKLVTCNPISFVSTGKGLHDGESFHQNAANISGDTSSKTFASANAGRSGISNVEWLVLIFLIG